VRFSGESEAIENFECVRERGEKEVADRNPAVNFDSKNDRVCVYMLRYIRKRERESSSLNGHHQVIVIAEFLSDNNNREKRANMDFNH
jgi:hypothetical protein